MGARKACESLDLGPISPPAHVLSQHQALMRAASASPLADISNTPRLDSSTESLTQQARAPLPDMEGTPLIMPCCISPQRPSTRQQAQELRHGTPFCITPVLTEKVARYPSIASHGPMHPGTGDCMQRELTQGGSSFHDTHLSGDRPVKAQQLLLLSVPAVLHSGEISLESQSSSSWIANRHALDVQGDKSALTPMSVDKPSSDWAASRFSECLQQVSCSCSHTMQCTEAAPILPIIAPKGLDWLMCGALRL